MIVLRVHDILYSSNHSYTVLVAVEKGASQVRQMKLRYHSNRPKTVPPFKWVGRRNPTPSLPSRSLKPHLSLSLHSSRAQHPHHLIT